MMNIILEQLRKVGVHYLKSDELIILEMLDDHLTESDIIDHFITDLLSTLEKSKMKKILLECSKKQLNQLPSTRDKMKTKGERVIYQLSLRNPIISKIPDYEIWPVMEKGSILFLSEVMGRNIVETEKFLRSMTAELPSQVQRMFTIYLVKNEPVGVVFPHLEPGKNHEGRIFWIGIHPNFRGKGLGKNLHLIGLHRLKNDFEAKSYIGATQIDNHPMRKIMESNGCVENKNTVISLEYSRI